MFNMYNKICEGIFRAASEEEVALRRKDYIKKIFDEIMIACTKRDDGSYLSYNDIDVSKLGIDRLPISFDYIDGSFYCEGNELITLKGCPKVVNGNFWCDDNRLYTLRGGPSEVDGSYRCSANLLVSLIGGPLKVNGGFYCNINELVTLKGCPREIGGSFWCSNNKLVSLEGFPERVGGDIQCNDNGIKFTEDDIRKVCNVGGGVYV